MKRSKCFWFMHDEAWTWVSTCTSTHNIKLSTSRSVEFTYGFFFSAGPNWYSLTLQQFCCKPFPFFHTKWRKFPLLYTQEAMRAIWWKKMFCLFSISKIIILPCHAKMAAKNGNGDTLLLVLEATSYQTKILRHIQFVCKVTTCKSTRKLISGLPSMSVYNKDGWKWALRTFHDPSCHETHVHFQLAQNQWYELGKTLLL